MSQIPLNYMEADFNRCHEVIYDRLHTKLECSGFKL